MIYNRFFRLVAQTFVLPALLGACSNEAPEGTEPGANEPNDGRIRFEIGFAQSAEADNSTPGTRAVTGTGFTSTWEAGDAIGIFACLSGNYLSSTASNNYINNVRLTYDGTRWNLDEGVILWWPGNSQLDFFAYYPYNEAATNPRAIAFQVHTDQLAGTDGKNNHTLSDLMTAQTKSCAKGQTVPLIFVHALSLVQVNVPLYGNEDLTVTLRGMRTKAYLDLYPLVNNPSIGITIPGHIIVSNTDNEPVSITMHRLPEAGYIYRALVPAQTVAAGTSLFFFNHENKQFVRDEPLAAPLTLKPGIAMEFTRSLPTRLNTTSSLIHTLIRK